MSARNVLRLSVIAFALALSACAGNVFDLEVGDCFDDGDLSTEAPGEIGSVPIVECAEPHDNEVYSVIEMEDDEFPGDEATAARADEACLGEFEGFIGLDYQTSTIDFGWLVPTADSWANGDRIIACFAYRVDLEKVTGTLEGSGI